MIIFVQIVILVIVARICNGVSSDGSPYIINGNLAVPGQFPYQVQVVTCRGFCGGSIIRPNTVLTAAHCLIMENDRPILARQIMVFTGSTHLYKGQKYSVENVKVHKQYTGVKFEYDIGLVFIYNEFNFSHLVAPIQLTDIEPEIDTVCTVCGWGAQTEGGSISQNLQFTGVGVNYRRDCRIIYWMRARITSNMLCAGQKEPGDPCSGDSGGGLVCNDKLAGIVSFGIGCGRSDIPNVYTNVFRFLDWIETNTARSTTTAANVVVTLLLWGLFQSVFHLIF